jgi:hypothetical protein
MISKSHGAILQVRITHMVTMEWSLYFLHKRDGGMTEFVPVKG